MFRISLAATRNIRKLIQVPEEVFSHSRQTSSHRSRALQVVCSPILNETSSSNQVCRDHKHNHVSSYQPRVDFHYIRYYRSSECRRSKKRVFGALDDITAGRVLGRGYDLALSLLVVSTKFREELGGMDPGVFVGYFVGIGRRNVPT